MFSSRALRRGAALAGTALAAGSLGQVLRAQESKVAVSAETDSMSSFIRRTPQRRPSTGEDWTALLDSDRPVLVGIAGGTGSGKTTVARAIAERIGGQHLVHISHDSYYRPLSHLPIEERAKANFDHPDALETSLLVEHLQRLRAGERIEVPTYDFATHSRGQATDAVQPARIVLVEGILIYAHEELRDMLDIKIFVDTDSDVRFIRRLQRDIVERGREVKSVINQYLDTVRPMHNQFVEPNKRYADVIIPTGLNSVALEMVIARLQQLCVGGPPSPAPPPPPPHTAARARY